MTELNLDHVFPQDQLGMIQTENLSSSAHTLFTLRERVFDRIHVLV